MKTKVPAGTPDLYELICDEKAVAQAVLADLHRLGLASMQVTGVNRLANVRLLDYGARILDELHGNEGSADDVGR